MTVGTDRRRAADRPEGTSDLGDSAAGIARRVVPVGMAVLTWLLVLLGGGAVLSDPVSAGTALQLMGLALLSAPLVGFRPWEDGVTGRVLEFLVRRRLALSIALGLLVLARLPVVADLFGGVFALLFFPLRAAPQLLFGPKVFYDGSVGEAAGQLLFGAWRTYFEFLWLYMVGAAVAAVVPTGGGGT